MTWVGTYVPSYVSPPSSISEAAGGGGGGIVPLAENLRVEFGGGGKSDSDKYSLNGDFGNTSGDLHASDMG